MLTYPKESSLIEQVPDPQAVRERLGQTLRDARLLRDLLKLAEKVQRERQQREEASHAD